MRRYKGFVPLLATLACALVILALGYAGIALGSEALLKTSQEPEKVTMPGDISNLFYSRIEDDVQLYPWNYFTEGTATGNESRASDVLAGTEEAMFTLIAVAADVEVWEVIQWFQNQNANILDRMETRYVDTASEEFFFFDDVIRLNGREYHVKFCANSNGLHSFSCIRPKEENIRDSVQWSGNKAQLSELMKNNDVLLEALWSSVNEMWHNRNGTWGWELYTDMYLCMDECFWGLQEGVSISVDEVYYEQSSVKDKEIGNAGGITDMIRAAESEAKEKNYIVVEFDPQMVELEDCILLMSGRYQEQAVYYDVIEQKVVGFHFF